MGIYIIRDGEFNECVARVFTNRSSSLSRGGGGESARPARRGLPFSFG